MPFANGKAIHGFEHATNIPLALGDLLGLAVVGTPQIIAAAARTGGFGLRIAQSAAAVQYSVAYAQNSTASGTATDRTVYSFYFKYVTKPSSGTVNICSFTAGAGTSGLLRLNVSTGFLEIIVGTGSAVSLGINPTVGTWYRVDAIWRRDLAAGRTLSLRVTPDGQAAIGAEFTATGGAETASTGRWLTMGSSGAVTQTIDFDDVLMSGHALAAGDGDYPITPDGFHHRVRGYLPNADGVHAVGTGTFQYTDNNGSTFSAIFNASTTSWSRVDNWPQLADGDASDQWVEKSAGTTGTDMVLWDFAPETTETVAPLGVHVHATIRNDALTTANVCNLSLRLGSTDAATLVHTGTIGSATMVNRGFCYPLDPNNAAWTLSNFNASLVRFSSTDVAPVPRVKGVMLEAAFQYAVGAPPAKPIVVSQAVMRAAQR